MSNKSFRLALMGVTFIWIPISILYISTNDTDSWLQNTDTSTINTAASTLSIEQSILCWKSVFESSIISKHIQIKSHQYTTKHNECITEINASELLSLLSTTNLILRQMLNSSDDKYIQYRQHLTLRRLIGIIFHRNSLHSHNSFKQFLDTLRLFNFETDNANKTFLNSCDSYIIK